MPADAAIVAVAIQERMTTTGQREVQNVKFAGEIEKSFAQTWSFAKGFVNRGTQFYLYQQKADDPSTKTVAGRFDLEGPLGRRASAFYLTRYRLYQGELVIEDTRVAPIYSTFPEPIMLVVTAETLLNNMDAYPDTYVELLQFVGERAANIEKPSSVFPEKKDYVIFLFLLDRISSSSKLEVKISNEKTGVLGYKDSTRYIDFDGWRVALLSGRFVLFDTEGTNPLYVKAVFTPGKEAPPLSRSPKLVGLFCLDGSRPQP
jgi:hypothetical protein